MSREQRIDRRLKLNDLRIFLSVVEAGAIGKAAKHLNYSQPAVSKALANLERTLGKRLLERGRRGIELTPFGASLRSSGAIVLDDLKNGLEQLEFLADPTAGVVRLGCTEPVALDIVATAIDRFAQRYPRTTFHVVPGEPPELYRELDARNVDFVITRFAARGADQHRDTEVLYSEPVVVVAAESHPCARQRRITVTDLANVAWALPPDGSFISRVVADNFLAAGLALPQTVVAAPYASMRLKLAASGRFVTAVPPIFLQICAKQLSLKALPLELRNQRRAVGVVTLKKRTMNPVAEFFIKEVRAVAKTMPDDAPRSAVSRASSRSPGTSRGATGGSLRGRGP